MLAQNKLAKTADLFILHARQPAFIARVVNFSELELIQVYQEADKEEIDKILKQMTEWYFKINLK